MDQKRIIIINGPHDSKGGVSSFNNKLFDELNKRKIGDVRILCLINHKKDNRKIDLLSLVWLYIKSIKKENIKITMISSLYYGIVSWFFSSKINKIFIIHGFRPVIKKDENILFSFIKSFLSYFFILASHVRSNKTFSNSYLTQAIYLRLFNIKTEVAPLFFSEDKVGRVYDEEIVYDISYSGNLIDIKNVDFILDIVRFLEENYSIRLKVCIMGEGRGASSLKSKAKDLKSDVHFTGHIPNSEVIKNISRSRVFIMPTYMESFGLSISESLSTGTYTLASKYSGIVDFLNDLPHLLVMDNGFNVKSASELMIDLVRSDYDKKVFVEKYNQKISDQLFVDRIIGELT